MSTTDHSKSFKYLFDAVYHGVSQEMGGPDCLNMENSVQYRRFLADLREYLNRHMEDDYTLTWSNLKTMYDAQRQPDWKFESAFYLMCEDVVERSEDYPAGQNDPDKGNWFASLFDDVSDSFMSGYYFLGDCDE